ncbi:MAG: hypothetical protein GY711_06945 [bacterium]|nr:hypothetical protein [bacterium]
MPAARVHGHPASESRALIHVTDTPRFMGYLRKIQRAVLDEPRHLLQAHYTEFLDGNFPGGEATVARVFFDLVEKLDLTRDVGLDDVRGHFRDGASLQYIPLSEVLARAQGRSVVVRADGAAGLRVFAQVLDGGRAPEDGEVVLRGPADVDCFVKSLVAREAIRINGGLQNLKLRNLKPGHFISLPNLAAGQELTVDLEGLRTHQNSKSYESVVYASLEEAFRRIDSDPR